MGSLKTLVTFKNKAGERKRVRSFLTDVTRNTKYREIFFSNYYYKKEIQPNPTQPNPDVTKKR